MLTIRVPYVNFRYAASLCIYVVSPVKQGHCPLHEPDATGQVKGCVPLPIAHQRVGVGFEEVLDHLVLASENSQVEGGLFKGGQYIRNYTRVPYRYHIRYDELFHGLYPTSVARMKPWLHFMWPHQQFKESYLNMRLYLASRVSTLPL